METPAAGLVSYELDGTVTNVNTGSSQKLNPKQYATVEGALFVANWLRSDPRTAAWGPFSVVSVDQSVIPWKYNVPLRSVAIGIGAKFNAGLWYAGITSGSGPLIQEYIDEMGTYATGQNVMGAF